MKVSRNIDFSTVDRSKNEGDRKKMHCCGALHLHIHP